MAHFPVPDPNRRFAKEMRRMMTPAELKLWNAIRAHRLMGLSFKRQMPLAGRIVDFACPARKLVIELDGTQHAEPERAEADRLSDARMAALGWTVLRFWNDDVLRDVDGVCQHIVTAVGLAAEDAAVQAGRRSAAATHQEDPHP
jgi:very-short-patch-repair endonuclease